MPELQGRSNLGDAQEMWNLFLPSLSLRHIKSHKFAFSNFEHFIYTQIFHMGQLHCFSFHIYNKTFQIHFQNAMEVMLMMVVTKLMMRVMTKMFSLWLPAFSAIISPLYALLLVLSLVARYYCHYFSSLCPAISFLFGCPLLVPLVDVPSRLPAGCRCTAPLAPKQKLYGRARRRCIFSK